MRIKLSENWVEYLCSMPESGMGYQVVDVMLKDGRVLREIVVFNAEELGLPPEYKDLKIEDIEDVKFLGKR
jgi:hypothetical protein